MTENSRFEASLRLDCLTKTEKCLSNFRFKAFWSNQDSIVLDDSFLRTKKEKMKENKEVKIEDQKRKKKKTG